MRSILSPTNKVLRDALSAMVKLAEEIGESTAEFFSLRCWEQCLELLSSLCYILRRRASSMILVPTESGWDGVTGTDSCWAFLITSILEGDGYRHQQHAVFERATARGP